MQPAACSTTYQCDFQWPVSMPLAHKGNHQFFERPHTAPHHEKAINLPVVCKEFAKSFDCGCKKHLKGANESRKKHGHGQPNCLHVNVFMPYQVNFSNIPVSQKKGKDGFNAYIYGSERKEALQAAAMKCTQRLDPTMRDINKKIDIKLNRPKTAPMRQDPCAAAHGSAKHPSMNANEQKICLTINDLKNIAEFVSSDKKKFEHPHGSGKGYMPKTSCNCGKP